MRTLPSAIIARTCRTMESPTITVSCSILQRGRKRLRVEISKTTAWIASSAAAPAVVSRDRSEGHLGRSPPGCKGPVQRNTRSRCGWSVRSVLHTNSGLVGISPGCFQCWSPLPQLGLLPKQLVDLPLHSLQLQLHRMQLERVLTCTQK